jgi:alpha-L-fucosidase
MLSLLRISLIGVALVFGVCRTAVCAADPPPDQPPPEAPAQRAARMKWWREARFGMFIHWGSVSLKGTEIGWSRGGPRRGYGSQGNQIPVEVYDNLYKEFNPTKFNAAEWVAIAQAAGMKYMVFTSRHHDGFSMFDTRANDYKITAAESPFRRDVVKELAEAARKANLPFGVYYSQPNWQHPDAFTDRHERYLEYLRTQVRELCTNYGPLAVFWYDGLGKSAQDYDSVALNRMIRQLQPHILINNRSGLPEDFDTPEQHVGSFRLDRPWETCMTICRQWAWKPDDQMKSLKQCLHTLVACVGGDGNLLFNVGPMPTGEIEPRQVARLKEMGDWLAKYGESIYATRGGPFRPTKALASTRKDSAIYLHILAWNADAVTLPNIPRKIVGNKVLTGGTAEIKQTDTEITVIVPARDRQEIDTIVKLELDGPASDIAPLRVAGGVTATASNVYRRMPDYEAEMAVDGDPHTRWATDVGTKSAWLEVDYGKPRSFGGVRIDEAYPGRVRKFTLQYRDGDEWKTALTGTTIGRNFSQRFAPVTAQRVRLQILEATEGPTINELQLLETARQ